VIPRLAQILFDELPEAEAHEAAERTFSGIQQQAGTPCWVELPGIGLLLGRTDGPVGHLGAGGAMPAARSRANYESLVRALLAEFARRQVDRCETELDPRLAERADALAGLGFTRQPESAAPPGTSWIISCALTETAEGDTCAGQCSCSG
jgi:hypothetical protein